MGYQLKVSGDPRRPSEVQPFKRPASTDDQPPDLMLLLAMVFGMFALLLKMKIAAWAALLCCLSSLANMRSDVVDVKSVISSLTFAVFGLVAAYLGPPVGRPRPGHTAPTVPIPTQ